MSMLIKSLANKLVIACICFNAACYAKISSSCDCLGNQAISHFDDRDRTTLIENYNHQQILLFKEHFEWHAEFPHLMSKRSLADPQGQTLISQTFSYNESGQLIEETMQSREEAPNFVLHSYFYDDNGARYRKTTYQKVDSPLEQNLSHANFFENIFTTLHDYLPFEQYIYEEKELLLRMAGHYKEAPEAGVYEGKSLNQPVRITFINGILNVKDDFMASVKKLSESHGGVNIHYVFRPTEGWAWDLLKSSLVKMGIVSPEAQALADTWKALIQEMGGVDGDGMIIHYAHSIGGTNTYVAKFLLSPEEQNKIHVITFGSPTVIPPGGFASVINYISVRDGVPLILAPIGQIAALFDNETYIEYVGTHYGIPIIDHMLGSDTYRQLIESHGKQFAEKYLW